ncbi:MAG TPA: hypothetical protein VET84_13090 [Stellaceae bacterium]|nr:hypothetical protein [Stellaceae bacterium]
MRNLWKRFGRVAAVAAAAFGLALGAATAVAQPYYTCPPGYYFAQGYGCIAAPPPPVYYYYAPPAPPPVVYPAPFFGLGFGFSFGGHDHDWHGGGGDWHHH